MTETIVLTPEFEYGEEYVWGVTRTQFENGVVQKRARWSDPKRIFSLHWDNAYRSERDAILALLYDISGSAGSFLWQPPDPIAPPRSPGTVSPSLGGIYALRTYYYAITWTTAYGETTVSEILSVAIPANQLFTLRVPRFRTSVTGANIYLGTSSSALQFQALVSNTQGTWTEASATGGATGIIPGAAPPTESTATELVEVSMLEDRIRCVKVSPVSYRIDCVLEEML